MSAQSRQELAVGDVLDDMAGMTGAVGEVGVGICGFGMDVRFEEAVFQADQDIREGQLIGGGGDGELDGGVKRVDVVEEHIQILWGPRPQEENVVSETFSCVLARKETIRRLYIYI